MSLVPIENYQEANHDFRMVFRCTHHLTESIARLVGCSVYANAEQNMTPFHRRRQGALVLILLKSLFRFVNRGSCGLSVGSKHDDPCQKIVWDNGRCSGVDIRSPRPSLSSMTLLAVVNGSALSRYCNDV